MSLYASEIAARCGVGANGQRRVLVRRNVEIIRLRIGQAEVGAAANGGHQQAALAAGAGIGRGEVGRVEHRHAHQVEPHVVVVDHLGVDIAPHAGGLDAPDGRFALTHIARRV